MTTETEIKWVPGALLPVGSLRLLHDELSAAQEVVLHSEGGQEHYPAALFARLVDLAIVSTDLHQALHDLIDYLSTHKRTGNTIECDPEIFNPLMRRGRDALAKARGEG